MKKGYNLIEVVRQVIQEIPWAPNRFMGIDDSCEAPDEGCRIGLDQFRRLNSSWQETDAAGGWAKWLTRSLSASPQMG